MGEGRPLFVQEVREQHPLQRVEIWAQDESRVGQQGRLEQVWARTGSRPKMVKQVQYKSRQVFGAVNPLSGASVALIRERCDTEGMTLFLAALAAELDPHVHVVLMLDGAGWHRAKDLVIPPSITLLFLPPYAPELMPMERVWLWMKSHHLSNRVFADEAAIEAACRESWDRLDPEQLKLTAAVGWISELGYLLPLGLAPTPEKFL